MKKQLMIIGLGVFIGLVGCAQQETPPTPTNKEGKEGTVHEKSQKLPEVIDQVVQENLAEGYFLTQGAIEIHIDALAQPILEALGEPMGYFEANSCAFQGKDRTYTYSGYELQTYELNEQEYISNIMLLDDSIATTEGVFLFDTLEKMLDLYGEPTEEANGLYIYIKEESKLEFIIESDEVVSIMYSSVKKEE